MIVLAVIGGLLLGTLAYSMIGLALNHGSVDFQFDYPTPYRERFAEIRAQHKKSK